MENRSGNLVGRAREIVLGGGIAGFHLRHGQQVGGNRGGVTSRITLSHKIVIQIQLGLLERKPGGFLRQFQVGTVNGGDDGT